ncbi:hypothetical protein F0919_04150 [Taibaiella lutea]|uniref:peptidylprolyl isomerase n=1 Tax=Taibaiella lutea TaxID=2608001 RepID=A0A5M6CSE2_9BACT|nr:FKBP-type peptidyl-prolyl cis-trans isomerase [Taibaiella lutea]KAA5536872.1 hypothetical protein F0919_04150 [Taibaiella lutea]
MLKKYSSLILASGILMLAQQGNAQTARKSTAKKAPAKTASVAGTGYTKGENSLDYKVLKHGTGLVTPQIGDVVEAHIIQKVGDSVVMNTVINNGGNPVSFKCQEVPVKGDLMEGIRKMKVGDSTIFRIPLDTIVTRYNQPRPTWAKKDANLFWIVKLMSIKPKAQVEAEEKIQQEQQSKMMASADSMKSVQADIDDKLIQEYLAKNNIKGAKKTASGLYYVMEKQGEGPNAMPGQKATVNYTGQNMQGEKFDSNVDPAFNHVSPFEFNVGQHMVIQGWDEGFSLLNKGSKATLYIPSGMAYGPNARAAQIPANAILIFDVELLDIK